MDAFALKYGNHCITLAQSTQLIGVKPKQNSADDAQDAVLRTLPAKSWKAEGTLGGFQLVLICDRSIDVDQALDQIRRDASILTGTHVFELPERRGIFVPTGELFVEFKPDTSAEVKQRVIDEFGLSARETRGAQGYLLAVTSRSPNPMKVAFELQRKSCVCVAEPDLASSAVIKVLKLADDASSVTAQARFASVAARGIRNVLVPRACTSPERAVALLGHFSGVRQMSATEQSSQTGPSCRRDVFTRVVRRAQASRHQDRACGTEVVAAPVVVSAPTVAQAPSAPSVPTIEIVVGEATIRVPAGVDLATLQVVLHAVRSTS